MDATAYFGRAAGLAFKLASKSPLVAGYVKRIDELAGMSGAAVTEYQAQRFEKVLTRARRLAYYDSQTYSSPRKKDLPILDKRSVRANVRGLRNPLVPARLVTTGGTGGRPLGVFISYASYFSEWAHIAYAWRNGGIELGDPKITFRGSSLGKGFAERPVMYQGTYNHLVVSPFALNDQTFTMLMDSVQDFRPRAIWGYPSAITPFAQWVDTNRQHHRLRSVRAVLLASEGAFDWQLELFQKVFSAKVVRWYGQTEKVVFGAECSLGAGYHFIPTYGLTEVVDGRMIGTGFTNSAMPLIRYDTEDGSGPLVEGCSCGSSFPKVTTIAGRWDQEVLWGHDDEPISTTALNFHDPIFMRFGHFQFRQIEKGLVTLLVTSSSDRGELHESLSAAKEALQARVGDRLSIEIEPVSNDALVTERGKLLAVNQMYEPGDR